MILDMRPMLRGEVDRIAIDFPFSPRLPEGVEPDGEARVSGEVTDSAGYMRLRLSAEVPFCGFCARCLDPVSDTFTVELERTVATEGTLTKEQLEENVDEYAVIQNGLLDLDELIGEEIFLTFPMRVLCSPDCPGLCPKCGKSLKSGACGCKTHEIDPRLAVLANYEWAKDEDGKS